jgi:PKD repeat protein
VDLSLLTGGAIYTSTQVNFSADLAPDNADKPYTYTIDYGDGTLATQATSSADPLPLTHTFATTGTHLVEIGVWNTGMSQSVTDTVPIIVEKAPLPPTYLTITGPSSGTIYTAYIFTVTVNPTATTPITYQWYVEGQQTITHSSSVSDTAILSLTTTGPRTISVTVSNALGVLVSTHNIVVNGPKDIYECNDACNQAKNITDSGIIQLHSFHDYADEDWSILQATAGITYVIEIDVPSTSTAQPMLELYDTCPGSISPFNPKPQQLETPDDSTRLTFYSSKDGPYYLRIYNDDPNVYGPDAQYYLSVNPSALIIVAGRRIVDDPMQLNIHNVTNAVYKLFRTHGYLSDQIYYLATDSSLDGDNDGQPDVHAVPNDTNLEAAITQWAANTIGPEAFLTIYLMGQGEYDKLYLDGTNNEVLTPNELAMWLDQLETKIPGVKVNIIVSPCYSGSFIDLSQTVSAPSRVVIASTGAYSMAYASDEGAVFDDAFISALDQKVSLKTAFDEAAWSVYQTHPQQTPWLDDNGNGLANETEEGWEAAQRYLLGKTNDALTHITINGPTQGLVDTAYTFTTTVNPITAKTPITYEWGNGEHSNLSHTSNFLQDTTAISWTTTGTYTLNITATNSIGPVTQTHTITISTPSPGCPAPLADVAIAGPTKGYTDTTYTFTGSIQPISPTRPMTYTWTPAPLSGQGTLTSTYQWLETGTHPITLTAENCGGIVTDTHIITIEASPPDCPHPLTDVAITGPTSGYTDTTYTFTGSPQPISPTQPVTYTWTPAPLSGQGTLTATYQWPETGAHPITLTAENCGGLVSATHTIAISPPPASGDYEPNDTCEQASRIGTDGTVQIHRFETHGDTDWIAFHATEGITYVIEARVPPTSTVDLMLELYDSCAAGGNYGSDDPVFNPDIRFVFEAPDSGDYYIKLFDSHAATYGPQATYHLSVQALQNVQPSGAIILVAGRRQEEDPLQENIYKVTEAIYEFATTVGDCTSDQVVYLAPEPRPHRTDQLTKSALRDKIVNWAATNVAPGQTLTLYMFDHGRKDGFYLDGTLLGDAGLLSPTELDDWLDTLEEAVEDIQITLIIEACHSGSFIIPPELVSGPNRLIITSTSAEAVAYASSDGAVFSDAFLNALIQRRTLKAAFDEGVWAVEQGPSGPLRYQQQAPWLDDDGDGVPNEPEDGRLAAQRSFACTITPPTENWPPHIISATVVNLSQGYGELWTTVLDDQGIDSVRAKVYPPSWRTTTGSEDMVEDRVSFPLEDRGENRYASGYPQFTEIGHYRITFLAQDKHLLAARPHEIQISVGGPSALPASALTFDIPIGNYNTTLKIPAEAVTATTTFTYTAFIDMGASPDLSGFDFAGRRFTLTAYQWGARQPSFTFERPVTMTVRYSDEDVESLDEESLALFYRDGDAWRTDGLTVTRRLTETNEVVVRAGHLTEFGLFGKEREYQVYLPLVLRE